MHIPIFENRIAQFAARFQTTGGEGFAYHGDPKLGGLRSVPKSMMP